VTTTEAETCPHAMHTDCGMREPKPEPSAAPAEVKVPSLHKRFLLVREVDDSGVSGVGVVAEGVEFTDGKCAVRWVAGKHRSTVIWDGGIDDVLFIHGHGGHTRVEWAD
jgi:hypothetical protein